MTNNIIDATEEKVSVALEVQGDESRAILTAAETMLVVDEASLAAATDFTGKVKKRLAAFEKERKDLTKPLRDYIAGLNDRFARYTVPMKEAVAVVTVKAIACKTELDRIAEENRKAEEERAEKERARLRRAADKAEKRGDLEKAAEFDSRAVAVSTAPVEKPAAPEGASFARLWDVEVTDLLALVRAVAKGDVPSHVVKADMVELRKLSRALQGTKEIPGLRFFSKTSLSNRG